MPADPEQGVRRSNPRKGDVFVKRAFLSVLLAISLIGLPAESFADQLARTREAVRPEIEGDPDEPHATAPAGTNFTAYAPDASVQTSARQVVARPNKQDSITIRLLRWAWRLSWVVR